jgi:predicted nucleotidyltransferase
MGKKLSSAGRYQQPHRYASPDVPLSAIRRFARQIAVKFQPEKIILFGSYAYGTPHQESDVDLMVIMPARNVIDQALRIDLALEAPFSVDLHVRTPKQIERGLREGDCDWFLREVMEKGKVLYEAPHGPVGAQSRGGLRSRPSARRRNATASRRRVLPLPTDSREVPQSTPARARGRRAKDPRSQRSCSRSSSRTANARSKLLPAVFKDGIDVVTLTNLPVHDRRTER